MLAPAAWKQSVNRRAGRVVFDLSGYTRFDAGAAYANGLLLRPLRYAVAEKRNRKRVEEQQTIKLHVYGIKSG